MVSDGMLPCLNVLEEGQVCLAYPDTLGSMHSPGPIKVLC